MAPPRTVLVVDANEIVATALRAALHGREFWIVRAPTIGHAIAAMRGIHVDVIVVDLAMRDRDGGSFVERRAALEDVALVPTIGVARRLDLGAADDPRVQGVARWPGPLFDLVDTVTAWAACATFASRGIEHLEG
jgi:CheY-like chemotaxis protein